MAVGTWHPAGRTAGASRRGCPPHQGTIQVLGLVCYSPYCVSALLSVCHEVEPFPGVLQPKRQFFIWPRSRLPQFRDAQTYSPALAALRFFLRPLLSNALEHGGEKWQRDRRKRSGDGRRARHRSASRRGSASLRSPLGWVTTPWRRTGTSRGSRSAEPALGLRRMARPSDQADEGVAFLPQSRWTGLPMPKVKPVRNWTASTPHMSVSTMATTSSSGERGPISSSATSAPGCPRPSRRTCDRGTRRCARQWDGKPRDQCPLLSQRAPRPLCPRREPDRGFPVVVTLEVGPQDRPVG